MQHILALLDFLRQAENLKNTLRHAYTSQGKQESAAEHSWRLCLMLVLCADDLPELDRELLLSLAIVHDLAEAICGDTPAILQTSKEEKEAKERQAIQDLCAKLPASYAQKMLRLWELYVEGACLEAQIVKGFDKLETLLQHTQGMNPPDFCYAFNLEYGRAHTEFLPILKELRRHIDKETQVLVEKQAR